jgi:hypothetical protein
VVHRFEPLILVLALLVLPVVLIEASDAGEHWKLAATVANWLIWVGFTLEVLFVAAVAPRRRAALRAHLLDVVIVVVTVPLPQHSLHRSGSHGCSASFGLFESRRLVLARSRRSG